MSNSGDQLSFPSLGGKEVVVQFNGGRVSSDAGLLLVKQVDSALGLTSGLSGCITDDRQQNKVRQSVRDMIRQRVYGIVAGYEDCNDFDTLCCDPLFKVASDRKPVTGADLASQPTLSRLENSISVDELWKMAEFFVRLFVERHRKAAPKQIILDLDATDDPAHGQQELEFYHGYYRTHCFLPLLVYATPDDNEQELLAAVLRAGNKHAGHGSVSILRRIVPMLREAFPECRLLVRGDAGFALPALYNWCEQANLEYAISLPKNSRLRELSADLEQEARDLFAKSQMKVRHFGEIRYAAGSWPGPRRVVVKAEMTAKGYNPRFVVTNLPADNPALDTPELLYGFYTDRGDVENRIKELKIDIRSGRTSCHRFMANQFRLMLHAAAFILLQALRELMQHTEGAKWQAGTMRNKLLKVGALVTESVRRIAITLPSSYPLQHLWKSLALA